jgi:hypothetical protein
MLVDRSTELFRQIDATLGDSVYCLSPITHSYSILPGTISGIYFNDVGRVARAVGWGFNLQSLSGPSSAYPNNPTGAQVDGLTRCIRAALLL